MDKVKGYKMWFEDGTEQDYELGVEVLFAVYETGEVKKM